MPEPITYLLEVQFADGRIQHTRMIVDIPLSQDATRYLTACGRFYAEFDATLLSVTKVDELHVVHHAEIDEGMKPRLITPKKYGLPRLQPGRWLRRNAWIVMMLLMAGNLSITTWHYVADESSVSLLDPLGPSVIQKFMVVRENGDFHLIPYRTPDQGQRGVAVGKGK